MLAKVVCPYYSVGYCKLKDQCHKEHHKEDCSNNVCQRKGRFKRHRKQCRYEGSCKWYIKDKSCEFLHSHNKLSTHDNRRENVTNQLKESQEYIVKIMHDILELKKMNKEKSLIIDDLKTGLIL